MKKIPIGTLLWRACLLAEDFICEHKLLPDVAAKEFLEQLKAYRIKRWGRSKKDLSEVVKENEKWTGSNT